MHMFTNEYKITRLIDDFKDVIETVEALLNGGTDQTGQWLSELKDKVEDSLHKAKKCLAEAQETLIEESKEAVKSTDEYVHENPWISIGSATALGVIVGMYLGSRK